VLRLAWYIRPIRFEIRFERKKRFAGPYNSVHAFHISLAITHAERNYIIRHVISADNKIVRSVCQSVQQPTLCAASYWRAGLAWLQHEWRCIHRWNDKQNCASAPVVTWPIRKSQSCTLSAFPQWSLPAWRWGNSTHRGTWPVTGGTAYHRPNHSSEFRIGNCQCQKTWLYQKTNVYQLLSHDQRTNNHHYCSCKQWIVHTRWRRRHLTIDMFKLTDVTASHVLAYVILSTIVVVAVLYGQAVYALGSLASCR